MGAETDDIVLPERIGRYQIERLLGRGGQGVVLLARDEELDRAVALKLLRSDPTRKAGTLASEARIVSSLQHPNVVTLHDVGRFQNMDYLVLEFIDGPSLKSLITSDGSLPFAQAVILMSQILAGVAYLHENGIVHRDLSPANILINRDGVPKVTDFGISVLQQGLNDTHDTGIAGTLRYMSPEAFLGQPPGPQSDVFTLASIFYEILCGERLYQAQSTACIMEEILNGVPIDMAGRGHDIEAQVANVLARASHRSLSERYASAREMKTDLDKYRLPHGRDEDGGERHSSIDFLIRRMGYKRGFSSLSQHVGELLEITADDSFAPANRLVNIIAKDITLSQRVLSLANSAYYGRAEISALPRAVVLLGIDQMRMCIVNALLENEFDAASGALHDAMVLSFHSALLAKTLAPLFEIRGRADAFTCAMFHNLGRMLTMHYFPDEYAEISGRAARLHCDELTASRAVLGVAFHELGIGVGTEWKLASSIVESMRPLPRSEIAPPQDETERLRICAAFANAVSQAVYDAASTEDRETAIAARIGRLSESVVIEPGAVDDALDEAAPLTGKYMRMLSNGGGKSEALARLENYQRLSGAA